MCQGQSRGSHREYPELTQRPEPEGTHSITASISALLPLLGTRVAGCRASLRPLTPWPFPSQTRFFWGFLAR